MNTGVEIRCCGCMREHPLWVIAAAIGWTLLQIPELNDMATCWNSCGWDATGVVLAALVPAQLGILGMVALAMRLMRLSRGRIVVVLAWASLIVAAITTVVAFLPALNPI